MFSKIKSRILLRFPSTVKKKYCAGLKFSNLMNIGKKKPSSLENPEKCVDTSGEKRSTAHVRPNDKIPKHALIVPQVRGSYPLTQLLSVLRPLLEGLYGELSVARLNMSIFNKKK